MLTSVEEIKTAIAHLPDAKRRELRDWYEQWDAQQWDAELEADVAAGRLDDLADAAIRALQEGAVTER